jgi:ubiquinone/menaquinone biosynthesis C-methylase UbiE
MSGYDKDLASNYSEERAGYIYTDKEFLNVLEEIGIEGKDILDFGCGDGIHSFKLSEHNPKKVVGIDPSEQMIELAKNKLVRTDKSNLSFLIADGDNLPFEDEAFDIVLANYVLVHFNDLQRPLTEIYRVLKPKGSFVATINNAEISDESIRNIPIPLQLGGKKKVIVNDYLKTDGETQEALKKTGFTISFYKKIDNPDAIVDPRYKDLDKVKNFHCVLFSAEKN